MRDRHTDKPKDKERGQTGHGRSFKGIRMAINTNTDSAAGIK